MLAKTQAVAELVQRYLDQIRDEHAGVTDGALATYIPELAGVDPTATLARGGVNPMTGRRPTPSSCSARLR
ncbi:MAG: glutaminase [Mycobacterium sp.]|jgi:hypothetical protein|nr:glutaminase [Mycobacterium sp.]